VCCFGSLTLVCKTLVAGTWRLKGLRADIVPVLGIPPGLDNPRADQIVAERGFTQALPLSFRQQPVDQSSFGLGVLWLDYCVAWPW